MVPFVQLSDLLTNVASVQKPPPDTENSKIDETLNKILSISASRQCADIRDRWYGILGLIPAARDFPVNYGLRPAAIALNFFEHFLPKRSAFVDFMASFNQLGECFEALPFSICQDCAGRHPRVRRTQVEARVRAARRNVEPSAKRQRWLLVVLPGREAELLQLDGEDKSRCCYCMDELVDGDSINVASVVRIAEDQLWCFMNCNKMSSEDPPAKDRASVAQWKD